MKKKTSIQLASISALLISGLMMPTATIAGNDASDAYWSGPGSVWRTGSGECLHTIEWSPAGAIEQCDPSIVAARDKAEEMAEIKPAAAPPVPRKVVHKIELQTDTFFEFDKAMLKPEGKEQLREVAQRVRDKRDLSIQIKGHTDRIGPEAYNQKLSEQRAMAVRDYLVELGIPASSLSTLALGESRPKASCEGIKGQALIDCLSVNRRTEVEFSAFEVVEEIPQ